MPVEPMHRLCRIVMWLGLVCLTLSCGGNRSDQGRGSYRPDSLTAETVTEVYDRYVQGDYEGYVAAMASLDDKPADYKSQMALVYKQHAAEHQGDDRLQDFKVLRIETADDGRAAQAFLETTYANGEHEEIMLSFVHDGKAWRLR